MTNDEFSKELQKINQEVANLFLGSVNVNDLSESEKAMIIKAFKQADELTKKMFPDESNNCVQATTESFLPNDIMEQVVKNIKDNEKFVEPISKDSVDNLTLLLNTTDNIDDFLNKI